ncbi:MAG: ABC transporter permease [Spirochaetales bacterium]|nr:ABC transporter permease [Spirochaetales bacterium]
MFFIKMALRNIFRNRKRAFLTGLIIGVGLASLMFTDALVIGMKENLIDSVTATFLGEAQIHREGFTDTQNSDKTIAGEADLVSGLSTDATIDNITRRAIGFGTISSPSNIGSVMIYGIDPSSEPALSKIDESIVLGDYLEESKGGVLIGKKLAERLEATTGSRIVLTLSKVNGGELSQNLFRVRGIFKINSRDMDESVAFITLKDSQEMMGLGNDIHEIAVTFTSSDYAVRHGRRFEQTYSIDGNSAAAWPALVPQMSNVLALTDVSVAVMVVIVFAVIVFGIVNTLFMSLYERLFEFGVLRAIGTRPVVTGLLITTEAAFLALYSIGIGLILGCALNGYFAVAGIDYTGLELAGATFRERIYTVFQPRQFIIYPLIILLFTVVVSIYPARFMSKMRIVRALQRTL